MTLEEVFLEIRKFEKKSEDGDQSEESSQSSK